MSGNPAELSFVWEELPSKGLDPGPRSRHGLVYHQTLNALLLFGGIVWEEDTLCSDTWIYREGTWSELPMRVRPTARHRAALAYDAERGQAVLFGGQEDSGSLTADTWLFAGDRWTRWSRLWGAKPSPRCGHSMAYDENARVVVLFGGLGPDNLSLGDTWLFDGRRWFQVKGYGPPVRRYAAFAYDPEQKGCVLHGGSDDERGDRGFGDEWLFKNGKWSRSVDLFDTDCRDDNGLAYHRSAQRMVMLDGVGGERGLLVRGSFGWVPVEVRPLHPRLQCSPLAWDDSLNGMVMHGGEAHHGGPQFDETWILRTANWR